MEPDDDEPDDNLDYGEDALDAPADCFYCGGTGWQCDGRIAIECPECYGEGVY